MWRGGAEIAEQAWGEVVVPVPLGIMLEPFGREDGSGARVDNCYDLPGLFNTRIYSIIRTNDNSRYTIRKAYEARRRGPK